jgi:hypothetical protein
VSWQPFSSLLLCFLCILVLLPVDLQRSGASLVQSWTSILVKIELPNCQIEFILPNQNAAVGGGAAEVVHMMAKVVHHLSLQQVVLQQGLLLFPVLTIPLSLGIVQQRGSHVMITDQYHHSPCCR